MRIAVSVVSNGKIIETSHESDKCFHIFNSKQNKKFKLLWHRNQSMTTSRQIEDGRINVKSLSAKHAIPKIKNKFKEIEKELLQCLPSGRLRLRYVYSIRCFNNYEIKERYSRNIWTIEFVSDFGRISDSTVNIDKNFIDNFIKLITFSLRSKYKSFDKLNIDKKTVLEFSEIATGFILHEAIGHRLESDDFNEPIHIKVKPNFEIIDSVGRKGWWGYTPIDDSFNRGKNIYLLKKCHTGFKTFLIDGSQGHLRSSDLVWHPIIRQRNLITKIIKEIKPPQSHKKLVINTVLKGSLFNEQAELEIDNAVWFDGENQYKVKPFTLTLSIREIFELNLYGKSKISHLAGGCHKDLQRQLPISFKTHSSWCRFHDLIK